MHDAVLRVQKSLSLYSCRQETMEADKCWVCVCVCVCVRARERERDKYTQPTSNLSVFPFYRAANKMNIVLNCIETGSYDSWSKLYLKCDLLIRGSRVKL